MPLGKSFDVQFVDDGVATGNSKRVVILPIKISSDDYRLFHPRSIVVLVERQVRVIAARLIGEDGRFPVNVSGYASGVRIHQQLIGIESQTVTRLKRPVHTIAIKLARQQPSNVSVPNVGGAFGQPDALYLRRIRFIEQTQLYSFGVLGVDCKINASAVPSCA